MLDDLPLMNEEWRAWQDVCDRLRNKRIEVNDVSNEQLVASIRVWGERLAALRRTQPEDIAKNAITEDLKTMRGLSK